MNTLIKDLLVYSYLANPDTQFTATDLNVVIDNILIDFELLIQERNFKIEVDHLPIINAIPLQMNQLFYNLISSAVKFYKKDDSISKIEISSKKLTLKQVRTYSDLDAGLAYCEIIIKDNGIGFNQQYENKSFTIFQRLQNNEVYIGTRIGL